MTAHRRKVIAGAVITLTLTVAGIAIGRTAAPVPPIEQSRNWASTDCPLFVDVDPDRAGAGWSDPLTREQAAAVLNRLVINWQTCAATAPTVPTAPTTDTTEPAAG